MTSAEANSLFDPNADEMRTTLMRRAGYSSLLIPDRLLPAEIRLFSRLFGRPTRWELSSADYGSHFSAPVEVPESRIFDLKFANVGRHTMIVAVGAYAIWEPEDGDFHVIFVRDDDKKVAIKRLRRNLWRRAKRSIKSFSPSWHAKAIANYKKYTF